MDQPNESATYLERALDEIDREELFAQLQMISLQLIGHEKP